MMKVLRLRLLEAMSENLEPNHPSRGLSPDMPGALASGWCFPHFGARGLNPRLSKGVLERAVKWTFLVPKWGSNNH